MVEPVLELEYSDCELLFINIDAKFVYKLHKYILATNSGYFKGLFRFRDSAIYELTTPFSQHTINYIFNKIYNKNLIEVPVLDNYESMAALNYFCLDDSHMKEQAAKHLNSMPSYVCNKNCFSENLKYFYSFAKQYELSVQFQLKLIKIYLCMVSQIPDGITKIYDQYIIGFNQEFHSKKRYILKFSQDIMIKLCILSISRKKANRIQLCMSIYNMYPNKKPIILNIQNHLTNGVAYAKESRTIECVYGERQDSLKFVLDGKYQINEFFGFITISTHTKILKFKFRVFCIHTQQRYVNA